MSIAKRVSSLLYRIFEPLIIGFMTVSFPNTSVSAVEAIVKRVNNDDDGKPKIRKGDLVSAYMVCKKPACSLDVFILRTKYLGWDVSHALKTPVRKNEKKLSGCEHILKEIYRNAYRPSVTMDMFIKRVQKHGMEWQEALYR